MKSLKFSKGGYNKVVDDQPPPPTLQPPPRHLLLPFLAVSLTAISTVTICLLTHDRTQPIFPDSIRAVCSVTRYPDSCFSAISNHTASLPGSDPRLIFRLSLQLAVEEVRYLTSLPETMILKANDKETESALRDCATLFESALSRLQESAQATDEKVGNEKVGDLNTWISAAMSDEDTCLDGLDEMGSTVADEVRAKVQRSKEYMSNSLAILSNMNVLLDKFRLSKFH